MKALRDFAAKREYQAKLIPSCYSHAGDDRLEKCAQTHFIYVDGAYFGAIGRDGIDAR